MPTRDFVAEPCRTVSFLIPLLRRRSLMLFAVLAIGGLVFAKVAAYAFAPHADRKRNADCLRLRE